MYQGALLWKRAVGPAVASSLAQCCFSFGSSISLQKSTPPRPSNPTQSLESMWSGSGRLTSTAANWIGAGGHWLHGTMEEWTSKLCVTDAPVIIGCRVRCSSPKSNAFCSTSFIRGLDGELAPAVHSVASEQRRIKLQLSLVLSAY